LRGGRGTHRSPGLPLKTQRRIDIKRHYPDRPVVGVGAVIFRGEDVLLVRRGQEPAKGSWTLPGGVVELGENLVAAILREVQEETGLAVKVLGITAVLERIFQDDEGNIPYHYVLVDFACDYLSGDLTPASDITAACFVSPDRLPDFAAALTAQVIMRAREQKKQGAFLPIIE
jgi:8-oxo-dGTP diphosphatase